MEANKQPDLTTYNARKQPTKLSWVMWHVKYFRKLPVSSVLLWSHKEVKQSIDKSSALSLRSSPLVHPIFVPERNWAKVSEVQLCKVPQSYSCCTQTLGCVISSLMVWPSPCVTLRHWGHLGFLPDMPCCTNLCPPVWLHPHMTHGNEWVPHTWNQIHHTHSCQETHSS